ncbi:hypothetical protein ACLQ22_11460 [Micromonospora sp. DT178]|uniref:hypothetical protein n=1 Tax=Micromonospora TaxID=1873 RepID=UPI002E125A12|nr:hypothetical protein OG989_06725 [Micromonospora sp. NBC_01740]
MRITGRRFTICAATTAAVLAFTASPALAVANWSLYHTNGDVAGAHAAGSVGVEDGRVILRGTLEDTAADGYSACLQTEAYYSYSSNPGRTEIDYMSKGSGKSAPIGAGHYSFAINVTKIRAREGLGKNGSCFAWATGWTTIYAG